MLCHEPWTGRVRCGLTSGAAPGDPSGGVPSAESSRHSKGSKRRCRRMRRSFASSASQGRCTYKQQALFFFLWCALPVSSVQKKSSRQCGRCMQRLLVSLALQKSATPVSLLAGRCSLSLTLCSLLLLLRGSDESVLNSSPLFVHYALQLPQPVIRQVSAAVCVLRLLESLGREWGAGGGEEAAHLDGTSGAGGRGGAPGAPKEWDRLLETKECRGFVLQCLVDLIGACALTCRARSAGRRPLGAGASDASGTPTGQVRRLSSLGEDEFELLASRFELLSTAQAGCPSEEGEGEGGRGSGEGGEGRGEA